MNRSLQGHWRWLALALVLALGPAAWGQDASPAPAASSDPHRIRRPPGMGGVIEVPNADANLPPVRRTILQGGQGLPPQAAAEANDLPEQPAAPAATSQPLEDGYIQLNLPPEIELKSLVEYVSKRLSMNIIYDESVATTKLTLLSPSRIKTGELLDLLRSALKMSALELVDTPLSNWKTIGRKATVFFLPVKNASPADLAKRAGAILADRDRIVGAGAAAPRVAGPRGPASVVTAGGTDVTLVPDAATNQIAIIATEAELAGAVALIQALDVPADLETRAYHFHHVSPQRVDGMMKGRLSADMPEMMGYSAIADTASGLLMVTARPSVHRQIELLVKELDTETDVPSNIQFYKLVNTSAEDVLETIRGLQSGGGTGGEKGGGSKASGAKTSQRGGVSYSDASPPGMAGPTVGPNLPSSPGLVPTPAPPAYHDTPTSRPAGGEPIEAVSSVLGEGAVVTADRNTNTLIVVAPADVQRLYKRLIATLDKRRPQVLMEVTLVVVDTSNGMTLGVELSKLTKGQDKVLLFSSFGLSTVDPATGLQTLNPATGFNGALISTDILNAVVQAVANDNHSRVVSAPKILTNDNATGTLASVSEEPFTSVNASQTVSTTSFAGYATAGTTVSLTPHISEGDYLQLKYSVTLNSFTGSGSQGVPPPRQTNTVDSEVTVPSGYAVIVGGLALSNSSTTSTKIPLLGDIPIAKYLFGLNTQSDSKSTLFVFIRPIILRDDQFEDLKYLSERDLAAADVPSNFPHSHPMMMR